MRDDQIFGLIASAALMVWLLGRGALPNHRHRRLAELAAIGLIGGGIFYALVQTLIWLGR